MSAKSIRTALGDVPRLLAVTAVVVAVSAFAAVPDTAAAAGPAAAEAVPETGAAADAPTQSNLAVEIQLTVNDGPLIDPRDVADVQTGDALAYTYRVTNTGDAVVTSPVVKTVTFTGSGELGAMFCPGLPRSLAPQMGFACGRTYVVSDDDASSGDLVHTVVASGTLAGGDVTSSGDAGSTITVVSSQASVGAQVASGDRGSAWVYLFPVAALIAVLFAVAWSMRDAIKLQRRARRHPGFLTWAQVRTRSAPPVPSAPPATAGDDVSTGQEEGERAALGQGAPRGR